MEVKINVNDLKQLIEEKAIKDLYYEKLKEIKKHMEVNALDKVMAVLDTLFLGV